MVAIFREGNCHFHCFCIPCQFELISVYLFSHFVVNYKGFECLTKIIRNLFMEFWILSSGFYNVLSELVWKEAHRYKNSIRHSAVFFDMKVFTHILGE